MPRVQPIENAEYTTRDVPQLLSRLGRDTIELIRAEGQLARAEIDDKVRDAKRGAASLATASVILLAGLIVTLMGAAYGLALFLPLWASTLIVGGSVTIAGAIAAATGVAKLRRENLKPDHTIHQINQDVKMAKEQAA